MIFIQKLIEGSCPKYRLCGCGGKREAEASAHSPLQSATWIFVANLLPGSLDQGKN